MQYIYIYISVILLQNQCFIDKIISMELCHWKQLSFTNTYVPQDIGQYEFHGSGTGQYAFHGSGTGQYARHGSDSGQYAFHGSGCGHNRAIKMVIVLSVSCSVE